MITHVYCCAECGEIQYKIAAPIRDGCTKALIHRWVTLGVRGSKKYECTECKKLVETEEKPKSYGCSIGVFHVWQEKVEV